MSGSGIADEAYRRLRAAIADERLEPGTPLSENDVARALGVSRTPVREALARLEFEGLAVRDANGRVAVLDLTADQFRAMFEFRAVLEGYGARLAAERISDAELERLDTLMHSVGGALRDGDVDALRNLNQEMHDLVLRASRNRVLVDLVTDLRQRLLGLSAFVAGDEDDRKGFVADHAELARLLSEGDGHRAAEVIEAHLVRAGDLLVQRLADEATDEDVDVLQRELRPIATPEGTAS